MTFINRPNRAGLDQLDDAPVIIGGVYLRAHLRGQLFVAGGQVRDGSRLINGVRERLLAIDMLAQPQRRRRSDRMCVVSSAHDNGINIFLYEQLAKIVVGLGSRVFFGCRRQEAVVNIAQGNDVLLVNAPNIFAGAMSCANNSHVELFVGRELARRRLSRRSPDACRGQRGGLQKLTAREGAAHDLVLGVCGATLAMASRRFSRRNGLLMTKSMPLSGLPEDWSISA